MVSLLLTALTGFLISLILLPQIIRYASKKNLFVQLDQRKIHKKITPSMGGIAIFAGFCAASLIWIDEANFKSILTMLAVLTIPFLIGFFDDRIHLRPSRKIIGQLVAATFVFFILDVRVTSLYGLFGDYSFPEWLSFVVTVVTIILVTNSFNLIDGIDGLAGTFSLIALLFFGIWFSQMKIENFAIISFALIGSVLAFLIKNWQPSKIFMGDTGSLVLGMSLSILAIVFLNQNADLPHFHSLKFNSGFGTVLCVLIVPIVDTIRVVIIRTGRGVSPLTADKRHIHHALVRIGKSHRFAVLLLVVVHGFFIINALLLKPFGDWYVVGSVTLFSVLLCFILDRAIARHTFSRKSQNALVSIKQRDAVKL
jgi:UDP-N-acetylmuramyl pentapeptide phosphotransferase/UDP-N-acetylglucosamine-1-phosphate transferase